LYLFNRDYILLNRYNICNVEVKREIVSMTIWTPTLIQGKPIYLAIADAMADAIKFGTLRAGEKLPPHRDLAWRLKVTVGTVTRAYKEAEIRGLLAGEVGRGSYVRGGSGTAAIPRSDSGPDDLVDLSHSIPPPVITAAEFDAALAHVMREPERLSLLDYTPPEGYARHRQMGSRWLTRCGITVSDADVVVCAGAHMGLIATMPDIIESGEAIMAENLNYPSLKPSMKSLGIGTIALEMDQHGLLPSAFEQAARNGDSRVLYIVPTLQNPTTHTMPRERREAIVDIARRYNITIVEDDIFRLLDERVQPPSFYNLAPERTFYITSLSKALAPGLRVGFVATPPGRARMLRVNQQVANGRAVGMTAEMARYWLETDIADSVISRVITEFKMRRQVFFEVFKGHTFRCEPGAPYAWVSLPLHWRPIRFAVACKQRGVHISPGPSFAIGAKSQEQNIRICFGQPATAEDLRAALIKVKELMADTIIDDFTPVA
jgi:DNA-binding transcriptional MocR family regulator